jgi:asparagine synthase (glutamine-hydrolysing)
MSQNRTNWRGGLDRSLQEDFFCESLPNWLHLEDRISMSESIEARLPFLDYRIVEFAFSLPNRLKIENGVTKRVLREAMKGYLPDSIISSFRKVPFSGPDSAWVRGPLRPWIENTFLKGDAKIYEYLEPAATRALFVEFLGSTRSRTHQYRVWKLINAELWMQSFF